MLLLFIAPGLVMPTYNIIEFTKATRPDLFEQAIALRFDVYVTEQGAPPDTEPDEVDASATHWAWLTQDNELAATGRLVEKPTGVAKIGRITVKRSFRGTGLGRQLMTHLLEASRQRGFTVTRIHAQVHAIPFYEKLGFEVEGEPFIEDNVPHVVMQRSLSPASPVE